MSGENAPAATASRCSSSGFKNIISARSTRGNVMPRQGEIAISRALTAAFMMRLSSR